MGSEEVQPRRRDALPARDNERLLATLDVIDVEGWDGPAATALLRYVREHLVCPVIQGLGMKGVGAWQAEATAWAAAWQALSASHLRTADCPWGVVWTAVRRAALGEVLAAKYLASSRRAWSLRDREPAYYFEGLHDAEEAGVDGLWYDPFARPAGDTSELTIEAAAVLTEFGWPPDVAEAVIRRVVDDAEPGQGTSVEKSGWRVIAADLNLPPWQVRRVMVALWGAPGWPGLAERILLGDDGATDDAAMRAALSATRVRSRRSPALAALRAAA